MNSYKATLTAVTLWVAHGSVLLGTPASSAEIHPTKHVEKLKGADSLCHSNIYPDLKNPLCSLSMHAWWYLIDTSIFLEQGPGIWEYDAGMVHSRFGEYQDERSFGWKLGPLSHWHELRGSLHHSLHYWCVVLSKCRVCPSGPVLGKCIVSNMWLNPDESRSCVQSSPAFVAEFFPIRRWLSIWDKRGKIILQATNPHVVVCKPKQTAWKALIYIALRAISMRLTLMNYGSW